MQYYTQPRIDADLQADLRLIDALHLLASLMCSLWSLSTGLTLSLLVFD